MNINIPCKNFLSLLLIIQMQLAAMDLPYPQLQLSKLDKKPVLHGKLMIDHLAKKDVHTYTIFNPVEYLTQDIRETYSYGNRFSTIPLDMPLST